jgi:hypothetical protein
MDYSFNGQTGVEHTTVDTNTLGDHNMYQNGDLIATQKSGVFPNTTNTYDHGHQTAHTQDNVTNGTDIYQNGHLTGSIKQDITGHTGLFDTNNHELGYLDSNSNVHQMMTHTDPLSQVNRINFQQLRFQANDN